MANREKGEVALLAGGATYTLCMTMNGLIEAENALGLEVDDIIAMLNKPAKARLGQWRALLWAGLRPLHANIDLLGAGEIMQAAGLPATRAALIEAMNSSFAGDSGSTGENPQPASGGAGQT